MMNLTQLNAKGRIRPGVVIRVQYAFGAIDEGVVFQCDDWGIKYRRLGGAYFGARWDYFSRNLAKFELVESHAPVALFGMVYDFVANRLNNHNA